MLVVVLAIGGGIFGTVILSADESTYEVTKYNFVTEVSGLFDTDTQPQYFDYDLSSNYTGYFTEDTVVGDFRYWGGATFTSTSPNSYPIPHAPDDETAGTMRLTQNLISELTDKYLPDTSTMGMAVDYWHKPYESRFSLEFDAKSKTLESLVNRIEHTGFKYLIISTEYDEYDYNSAGHTISFATTDEYTIWPSNTRNSYLKLVDSKYYSTYPTNENFYIAAHTAKINLETGQVELYAQKNTLGSNFVKAANLSDVNMVFYPHYADADAITITIKLYNQTPTEYMDISQGVRVTGGTSS